MTADGDTLAVETLLAEQVEPVWQGTSFMREST